MLHSPRSKGARAMPIARSTRARWLGRDSSLPTSYRTSPRPEPSPSLSTTQSWTSATTRSDPPRSARVGALRPAPTLRRPLLQVGKELAGLHRPCVVFHGSPMAVATQADPQRGIVVEPLDPVRYGRHVIERDDDPRPMLLDQFLRGERRRGNGRHAARHIFDHLRRLRMPVVRLVMKQ